MSLRNKIEELLTNQNLAVLGRRGGMLIHGAIIAREYGIPCVTGIPEASEVIKTGDLVTVDGYLGIVTINRAFKHQI